MTRFMTGAAVLALLAGTAQAEYTLHVLHINDLHSRIEPINRFDSTCSAADDADGKCFGGVARLATKINTLRDSLRAEGKNVIVVDAGDQFQGSLMFTTYKGAVEAEFMVGFRPLPVGGCAGQGRLSYGVLVQPALPAVVLEVAGRLVDHPSAVT